MCCHEGGNNSKFIFIEGVPPEECFRLRVSVCVIVWKSYETFRDLVYKQTFICKFCIILALKFSQHKNIFVNLWLVITIPFGHK